MSDFKRYRRRQIAELRPYMEGEVLDDRVSISASDIDNGSPKVGDMIARNPKNHEDQWLVAQQYFIDNFEEDRMSDKMQRQDHAAYLWPDGYSRTTPPDQSTEEYHRWLSSDAKTVMFAFRDLQSEQHQLILKHDQLRKALDHLTIAVAGVGVRHPQERALLQEQYDIARKLLQEDRDE